MANSLAYDMGDDWNGRRPQVPGMMHHQPPPQHQHLQQQGFYAPAMGGMPSPTLQSAGAAAGGAAAPSIGLPVPPFDSEMATKLGLVYGEQAFSAGRQMFDQNLNRYVNLPALKYYFAVSNEYVLRKLRLLLFPFTQKAWNRMQRQDQSFQQPRDDVNAPDLYIPLMSFVTYILLVGVTLGQQNKFKPEILGVMLSKGVGVVAFEVLLIKFGFYLINLNASIAWLDLVAYAGYKFVPIIVTLLAFMAMSTNGFWLTFAYTSAALAFFLLRSLGQNLVTVGDASTSAHPPKRRRNYFLLGIAALQIVTAYFLLLF